LPALIANRDIFLYPRKDRIIIFREDFTLSRVLVIVRIIDSASVLDSSQEKLSGDSAEMIAREKARFPFLLSSFFLFTRMYSKPAALPRSSSSYRDSRSRVIA